MDTKGRVLVVDDSATIRQQLIESLSSDFECLGADNGNAALEVAMTERIDVIVTDLHMPAMGGAELLRELRARERTKKIPVLVMTTETGLAEVNECRRLGCAGYVLKPVDATYLRAKIRKMMDSSSDAG